jgi:hypothetical protein
VKSRWPELANPYHPLLASSITEHGDDIVQWIKTAPDFRRFNSLGEDLTSMEQESEQFEVKWARHQRFIRAAENAVLAANLKKLTSAETMQQYEGLVEMEKGVFPTAEHVDAP